MARCRLRSIRALRRLAKGGVQALALATGAFWFVRFVVAPRVRANLARQVAGQCLGPGCDSESQLDQLTRIYTNVDLHDPTWRQYLDYLGAVLTGDFGRSLYFKRPVAHVAAETLSFTVLVVGLALAAVLAVAVGTAALRAARGGTGRASAALLTALTAVPALAPAVLLVGPTALPLHVQRSQGVTTVPDGVAPGLDPAFVGGVLANAAVVALPLAVALAGGWALATRGAVDEASGGDSARAARIRGVDAAERTRSHLVPAVARSTRALALTTVTGALSAAVVVESVLRYGGAGYTLVVALRASDFPLLAGLFLAVSLAVVVAFAVADLLWLAVDPTGGEWPADWRRWNPALPLAPGDGVPVGSSRSLPLRDRLLGRLFGFSEEELRLAEGEG
ncbi:MAG: ABC transporter permease subunit [Halobacteriaceae archaeon]